MADKSKLLATIARGATEQLQIALCEFKDKKYLDLRIFYTTDSGETWLPTKKGVTVSPDNLEVLKDAIDKAIEELADGE